MKASPPLGVLRAFGVDAVVELEGGQGKAFASRDVVLKPTADEAEAIWTAELFSRTEQRGFRLARPIASASGSFVVDGWTAWSRLRGEHHLQGGPWPFVVELCERFHRALQDVPRPSFLDRRQDHFARADRFAWNELVVPLVPEIRAVVEPLAATVAPSHQPSQVIHADFAGNILFAADCEPAIIDFSPYWRPAGYALALAVVDAMLWYGGSVELLSRLGRLTEARQMVARALIFRLTIDGLFACEDGGEFWSAAIARDLANARPLLQYLAQ